MYIVVGILWVGVVVLLLSGWIARSSYMAVKNRLDEAVQLAVSEVPEDEELAKPLLQRLLAPHLERFGKIASKSLQSGQQVADLLARAGNPMGMGVREFMGLKFLAAGVLFLVSVLATPVLILKGFNAGIPLLFCLPILGFIGPNFVLSKKAKKRIVQIRKALPDLIDLLVVSIEAGIGFDGALSVAVTKTKGPLTEELARVLGEIKYGKARAEAMADMAERARLAELSLLVTAVHQAETMGTGMAQALRAQATQIRDRHIRWVREQVAKLPTKMIFPLVFLVFPALFVVIMGPAVVSVMNSGIMGTLGK